MVVNGNYVFLDFEKAKPFLIDVLCRYYGYENEEEIKIKLDNTTYHGWHDYRNVVDNYNIQIEKYRDEIVSEFYKLMEMEENERITEILFPKENPITNSIINIACDGGEDLDNDFTLNAIKDIENCRDLLSKIFKIDKNDEYFENILNIKKSLNTAIKKIEKKYPCDVFNDTRVIFDNRRKIFQKYLKCLSELGINIVVSDGIAVGREDFDDSYLYNMDSYSIYFDNEFLDDGLISCFLQDNLDELSLFERYSTLMGKLRFLYYSHVDFKYIDDLSDIHCNQEGLNLLYKEYNYQKNHYQQLNSFSYDEEDRKKEWKKGNFLPKNLAQAIENTRNELQNELFFRCKNFDNFKRCNLEYSLDGLTSYHFNENDHMKPYYNIYVNEDSGDLDYVLSILMHEINHVMGFSPMGMGKDNYLQCKEGLNIMSFNFMEKFTQEGYYWDEDEEMTILRENIVQRMARELTELYLKHYKNPYSQTEMTRVDHSEYEDYDFITEDFYEVAYKLLKENVLAKTQKNLYYDSEGYYEKKGIIGSLARRIRGNYYKHQDDNRRKYSVKDVKTLGSLVGFFEKEVLYYRGILDITPEQMESGEYKQILDKDGAERLEYILKERAKFKKFLESKKEEPVINVRNKGKNDNIHEK